MVLLFLLPGIAIEAWKISRLNLVAVVPSQRARRRITIMLFHRRIYTLAIEIERRKGELGVTIFSTTGDWRREEDALILGSGDHQAGLFGDERGPPTNR